jgi:recombination protein RecA
MGRITPREVRDRLDLNERQQAILVGTLLGDGCLAKHGNYHRLHIKHKLAQVTLAELKREAFGDFVTMPLHQFDQQLQGRAYPCVQFATRTSPIFTEWHRRFYLGRRKIVPEDIATCLSPLSLAVWFMDDGAADYAGLTIQTHNFLTEEVELLRSLLGEMFGLKVSSRSNKGKRILYLKASSLERFETIVGPHLLPDLSYKLVPRRFRNPVETTRWPQVDRPG